MSRREFSLTLKEADLINSKILNYGYKLEPAENYPLFTTIPSFKAIPKIKQNFDPKKKFENLQSKMEYFLKSIISNDLGHHFYYRDSLAEPSLMQVEKNLNLNKYNSLNEMFNEIKKIYQYYFDFYQGDFEMSTIISRLYDYSENLIKTLEPNYISTNYNLNHQNRTFFKTLEIKNNNPLSKREIITLSRNIKKLTSEHLVGLVKLLTDNYSLDKSKNYFEFDITYLTTRKAREVEAYVKFCLNDGYVEYTEND